MFLQVLHQGCYSRGFLANGHIDTVNRMASLVETALVDNGIDGDSGLTRLAVSDDKLALATADRYH